MNIKSVLAEIVACAIVASSFFTTFSDAQVRQKHLYIDDGFGSFTILSGASGGGSFTFPTGGGGMVLTTGSSSSITSLGTITSGMWESTTPIAPSYGGTGLITTPTDGQLLIGQTSPNGYVLATLTQGTGISITNGPGTITIAATGGGSSAFSAITAGTNTNALLIGSGGSLGTTGGGTITATTAGNVTGLVSGVNGGTGVANSGKTITLGGNVTTSGAYDLTLTLSNTTGVTLPSSGTLIANPMTTLGDMMYGGSSPAGTPTQLSGNTSSRKEFLRSTGASSAATAPAWDTIATGDMPVFGKSGTNHTVGAVPDPGSTADTTKFLRDDATWAAPSDAQLGGCTEEEPLSVGGPNPDYWDPGASSTLSGGTPNVALSTVMLVTRSGTIKNFFMALSAKDNSANYWVFTLRDVTTSKNGPTVNVGGTSLTASDVSTQLPVSAGDQITLVQTWVGNPSFATTATWAFELQ